MGGYLLAQRLHVSGPLAMVVAGLLVGYFARQDAMSRKTEGYVYKFWKLIDLIINVLLFVLIGVEPLVIKFECSYWFISGLAVVLALALSISNAVPHKAVIVAIICAVVLFSVIGQGLTLGTLIRRLYPEGQ